MSPWLVEEILVLLGASLFFTFVLPRLERVVRAVRRRLPAWRARLGQRLERVRLPGGHAQ